MTSTHRILDDGVVMTDHEIVAQQQSVISRQIRAITSASIEKIGMTLSLQISRDLHVDDSAILVGLVAAATDIAIHDAASQVRQVAVLRPPRSRRSRRFRDPEDVSLLFTVLASMMRARREDPEVVVAQHVIRRAADHEKAPTWLAAIAAACEYEWIWRAVLLHKCIPRGTL